MSETEEPTARRADVRTTVVEAAARLLREEGGPALTTRRVAQEAGVQAPTLYRLFGDKDGLLEAVAEQVMATYVAAKSAAAEHEGDGDPLDDLRAGWRLHVDFGLANPHLVAVLGAPGRRSAASVAGLEVLRRRVHRLAAAGRLRVEEGRAVAMIHAAGTGAVSTLLALPPEERDPGLSDALFEAVAAAVLSDVPVPPTPDALTTAVTFGTLLADLPGLTGAERALMAEWLDRSVRELQDRR